MITEEQKERANRVNLPDFLRSHGFDLKKSGREYIWKEHDSVNIKDNAPVKKVNGTDFPRVKAAIISAFYRSSWDCHSKRLSRL